MSIHFRFHWQETEFFHFSAFYALQGEKARLPATAMVFFCCFPSAGLFLSLSETHRVMDVPDVAMLMNEPAGHAPLRLMLCEAGRSDYRHCRFSFVDPPEQVTVLLPYSKGGSRFRQNFTLFPEDGRWWQRLVQAEGQPIHYGKKRREQRSGFLTGRSGKKRMRAVRLGKCSRRTVSRRDCPGHFPGQNG